jgi:uncharacterized protein (TIGR02246 family)
VDDKKKSPKTNFTSPDAESDLPRAERQPGSPQSSLEDFYQSLQLEMKRRRPAKDEIAAVLEAAQHLAAEAEAEDSAAESTDMVADGVSAHICRVCGYRNREGNKFCAMCGLPVDSAEQEAEMPMDERLPSQPRSPAEGTVPRRGTKGASTVPGTHHYHHHYHHHYFPGGSESSVPGGVPRQSGELLREPDKLRSSAILRGESMSRAEAAVRRVTQEWVLACNTKHLDDLLELYVADALVLRSNYTPVRGAAAIREFFFGALDAGLGEVEVEPVRVEIDRDMAYEAGRCKALVPGAAGKRREERGKYLWVFARQSNGEWKLAADCWSSDLTLGTPESDVTLPAGAKPGPARKNA